MEQALEKEFDRDRRLHGWAREGMDMDRDDFIDLALVSKQVPGKTPAQASRKSKVPSRKPQARGVAGPAAGAQCRP